MAGDDAQAKASVSAFIKSLGLCIGTVDDPHDTEGAGRRSVAVTVFPELVHPLIEPPVRIEFSDGPADDDEKPF
ncbi:MAG: hypothetical protein QOE74_4159 [Mycobacterium sp.]|nr:hypothetical protein [Mycobacterium sp.]